MSHSLIPIEGRTLPLRRPDNWKVKFPRYMLELPQDVNEISISYVGLQPRHNETPVRGRHDELHAHITSKAQEAVAVIVEEWIDKRSGHLKPALWEKLYVETGYEVPDTEMYILYWTDKHIAGEAMRDLDIRGIYASLSSCYQEQLGIWQEYFTAPKSRLETIYSGNDYHPGMASLPGVEQVSHSFTGYWGAARDRFPASADDAFEPEKRFPHPNYGKDTKWKVVSGYNEISMIHIRSGQYWDRCEEDERVAYETVLEPVLRRGMAFLEENAVDTGDLGLRFSRNITTSYALQLEEEQVAQIGSSEANSMFQGLLGRARSTLGLPEPSRPQPGNRGSSTPREKSMKSFKRRETCSSGFFRSLRDLENWAAKHPTHHHIFHGAHEHSNRFGKEIFKMRTWHEVAALKPGEVFFQYINCEPRTGLMPFVDLESYQDCSVFS